MEGVIGNRKLFWKEVAKWGKGRELQQNKEWKWEADEGEDEV